MGYEGRLWIEGFERLAPPLTVLPDISSRKLGESRLPLGFRQSPTSTIGEIGSGFGLLPVHWEKVLAGG